MLLYSCSCILLQTQSSVLFRAAMAEGTQFFFTHSKGLYLQSGGSYSGWSGVKRKVFDTVELIYFEYRQSEKAGKEYNRGVSCYNRRVIESGKALYSFSELLKQTS